MSTRGFNSPLGILVVRTLLIPVAIDFYMQFQFPARNSGCSDLECSAAPYPEERVSIPRSEFWLFGRVTVALCSVPVMQVSIPRSEFWLFGHGGAAAARDAPGSFNSPLGILVVRTPVERLNLPVDPQFQFPARNSGCSDESDGSITSDCALGFQFPARNSGCSDVDETRGDSTSGWFQFPARNSGCSD